MNITAYGNPVEIEKICEWTGKTFIVDQKHRNQRFINKDAMYAWRKSQNRETVMCLTCGNPFERYKRILHPRSGKLVQYCSNKCSRSSDEQTDKARIWMELNQPMHNQSSREKIKQSKLERYGNASYNNMEKCKKTMMDRYGVHCVFYLPSCKSNGRRISKFQRKVYVDVLKCYPDAKLEVYLPDVKKAVDIYIPSIKMVVECHGDYWHCNPSKCSPEYYNKLVHLTAREIWDRDDEKRKLLESNGYTFQIVWENTNKTFKHHIEC